jgi:tetratricopeptide (TPR) repeat protein
MVFGLIRRTRVQRAKLAIGLWLFLSGVCGVGNAMAQPSQDEDDRAYGRHGLDLMMDGDLEGAIRVFKEIQKKDPQSPVGYLLEADAVWWRIYYSTANLVDPDVFAATDLPSTPYDAHFEDLLTITIAKSQGRIESDQEVARGYLYQGMAYALRARLTGLRDKDLPTARAGKKMRTLLLKALELDPNLTDAYLGVGIYNYFVDTLSAIVKILRWFIGLPGGSRVEGLKQMQLAAEKGDLARTEAKFYLAKDYSRQNERQFERSMQLFRELEREYPRNPLWPMLIASLHCRMGHGQECDAGYRDVYNRTAGATNEVEKALHSAARHALQRRHPQERFPE